MAQMKYGDCFNLEAELDLLDPLMLMSSAAALTGNLLLLVDKLENVLYSFVNIHNQNQGSSLILWFIIR